MTSLLNANWADVNDACYFSDPTLAYDLFEAKYRVLYNYHFPVIKYSAKKIYMVKQPWMTITAEIMQHGV